MSLNNENPHSKWMAMNGTEIRTCESKHYQEDGKIWFTVPEKIYNKALVHAEEMVHPDRTKRRKACLRDGQSGKTGFALTVAFCLRKLLGDTGNGFYLRYLIQKSSVNLRSDILSDLKKIGWKPSEFYVDILPNYRKKEQNLKYSIAFSLNTPGNKPPHILTILDECHIAIAINGTLDKQIMQQKSSEEFERINKQGDAVTDDDFTKEGWSFVKPSEEWLCDNHYVLSISATDTINNLLVFDALAEQKPAPCDLFYIAPDENYIGVEFMLKNDQMFQACEPFVTVEKSGKKKVVLSDFEKVRLTDFFQHCYLNPDARRNLVRRVPRCGGKNYNGVKGYQLYVKLASEFLFNQGQAFQNFHINVLHSDFRTVDFNAVETWYTQYPISKGAEENNKQSTLDMILQKNPTVPTINIITESMTIGERITTWEHVYAMIDSEFARADVAGQSIYRTCGYWDKEKHKVKVYANIEGRRKTAAKGVTDMSFIGFQEYYKDIDTFGHSEYYPSSGYNIRETRILRRRAVKIAIDCFDVPSEHLKWYADKYMQIYARPLKNIDYSTYTVKDNVNDDGFNMSKVFVGRLRYLDTVQTESQGDWLIMSGALKSDDKSDDIYNQGRWGTFFADQLIMIRNPQKGYPESFKKFDAQIRKMRWEKNNCEGRPQDERYAITPSNPAYLYREYPEEIIKVHGKVPPNVLTKRSNKEKVYKDNQEQSLEL
jgi:hypothetical protein